MAARQEQEVERVEQAAESAALWGGVARSWTVPSPPPGACGARFGAEVESEHPPGGSPLLAGAEGVQCNQSRAESPPRTPPITML